MSSTKLKRSVSDMNRSMMTNPVTERLNAMYFKWLVKQVYISYRRQTPTTCDTLMELMWNKPFPWVVDGDRNRVEDGLELRYLFLNDESYIPAFEEMNQMYGRDAMPTGILEFRDPPCRTLEVLIALARRLEFQTGDNAGWWAWRLLSNLELNKMKDPLSKMKQAKVDDILETLIWRTYARDGAGGFFPLSFAQDDQRKVEIWYQMSAYLAEYQNQ